MIGLLLTWIAGFEGIPIPYSPKLDDGITVLLLCCFFMSAYVYAVSDPVKNYGRMDCKEGSRVSGFGIRYY